MKEEWKDIIVKIAFLCLLINIAFMLGFMFLPIMFDVYLLNIILVLIGIQIFMNVMVVVCGVLSKYINY